MDHSFSYDKGKITVTGVKKLDGFGEREARILLENGSLLVKGNGFELTEMAQASGKVAFSGTMTSATYSGSGDGATFFKKIFR